MEQTWRLGEVARVEVSPAIAKTVGVIDGRFELRVQACSQYLHPAHCISLTNPPSFSLSLRQKDLQSLHKHLRFLYPTLSLPSFPASKWLILSPSAYIRSRAQELEKYFTQLLAIGEIRRSLVLMQTLSPNTQLIIRLIGHDKDLLTSFRRYFLDYKPETGRFTRERLMDAPIDLIIEGKVVRIVALECINAQEGMWLLEEVKDKGITIVVRSEGGENRFKEGRWSTCSHKTDISAEQLRKDVFDSVLCVVRDYLKQYPSLT